MFQILRYVEFTQVLSELTVIILLLFFFSAPLAYKTVSGVNGPLVILDQVKVRIT